MRKKRILFCSEATFLNTGYATYTREILNYLSSTNKYEIAELAAYGQPDDPRISTIPWKFYPAALPKNSSQEQQREFASKATNQFGEYVFESVCLDFMPDVVCDIRDFWMMDFIDRSPYRKFFNWCIMPTVDAEPQARQWIATYQTADACLSYSNWSGDLLQKQSGNKINYIGSAPPSAHPAYQPAENIDEIKNSIGIDKNWKIVGTVMRNQRRKLYPDLFEAFKLLLEKTKDPNLRLYCHTSYPDMGWDVPELLQQYKLSSKVLFTYVCTETNMPFASLFKGAKAESPYTKKLTGVMANVKQGLTYEQLSNIINVFDVYIQYANSEGFGLPQVEAAACAIPVMSVDYSAMSSVIRQLGGTPLPVKTFYKELETGCLRAVPDNDATASLLEEFFKIPKTMRNKKGFECRNNFLKHFQWDKSGAEWEKYFDSVELKDVSETWKSPPDIQQSAPKPDNTPEVSYQEIAYFLINQVLKLPEKCNEYMFSRTIRDLMYGNVTNMTGGMYMNECSTAFENTPHRYPFNFDIAYQKMKEIRDNINQWEQRRMEVMNNK